MDQNIFHYLGKRPLKVSTQLGPQVVMGQDDVSPDAIELPPAGATSIGLNIPGPQADATDAVAAAEAEAVAAKAAQLDYLRAASGTGDWPGADHYEGADVPEPIIGVAGDAGSTPAAEYDESTPEAIGTQDGPTATHPDDWHAIGAALGAQNNNSQVSGTPRSEPSSSAALPWRNNPLIMAIAAAAIAIYLAWNASGFADNDIWFILATGREIFEQGILYTNPFSMHDGMGIVVQQWIPCLIAYGLYSLGGFVALGLWCAVLSALVVLSLYRLGRLLKADRYGGEWILLVIAVALPALLQYLSMRPHAYTMLAFCWLLFFLTKYRRTGKPGWLIGAVALVAAHTNFQMALAPFDLVIIACFAVPDVLAPFHKRGRLMGVQLIDASGKHWTVLLCLLASVAALLANPYGIDGALYLVNSYGTAGYQNYIMEMRALSPWAKGLAGMASVALLVLAAMAVGKRGLRHIDLPLTLLAFGVGFAAFSHSRNGWLIAFFALPLVLSSMHGWSMDFAKLPTRGHRKARKSKSATQTVPTSANDIAIADPQALEQAEQKRRRIVLGCTIAVCVGASIATGALLWHAVPSWQAYEKESDYTPSGLLDYMEQQGVNPQDVRLFNPFNIGGYLEWRGYKVFMDPRPELWSPGITGLETDYYREYVDMQSGDWTDRDYEQFLERNGFQYLIVENGTKIATYLKDFQSDYISLLGTGDYTLWGKANASTDDPAKSEVARSASTESSGGSNAPAGNESRRVPDGNRGDGRDAAAQPM